MTIQHDHTIVKGGDQSQGHLRLEYYFPHGVKLASACVRATGSKCSFKWEFWSAEGRLAQCYHATLLGKLTGMLGAGTCSSHGTPQHPCALHAWHTHWCTIQGVRKVGKGWQVAEPDVPPSTPGMDLSPGLLKNPTNTSPDSQRRCHADNTRRLYLT